MGRCAGDEGLADLGEIGPLTEVLVDFLVGFIAFAVEASLLDPDAGDFVVATAKLGDVAAEIAQCADFALQLFAIPAVPSCEYGGVPSSEHGSNLI